MSIFKFDENGRKFDIRVENTAGKGEIASYDQFLLFSTIFSKDFYCRHVKTRACLEKDQKKLSGTEKVSVLEGCFEVGKYLLNFSSPPTLFSTTLSLFTNFFISV